MTFDAENMENKIGTQNYEKPSLKKYGTMKELTYASQGSGGDSLGTSNTGGSPNTNRASSQGGDADGIFSTSNANDSQFD